MDYSEVIFFGSFSQDFSFHKYCRAVLNGNSDSASNSASESSLLMVRQCFIVVDN
jgi:hypothetical protein